MHQLGLIGLSLKHSFSPAYFKYKFEREGIEHIRYDLFELQEIEDVLELMQMESLKGFNVTIPYKTSILPFLNHVDNIAKMIGAVNCVAKENDGWKGYNTDWIGFRDTLVPLIGGSKVSALVLGNGGASRAICYTLRILNIPYTLLGRSGVFDMHMDQLDQEILDQYQLLIHCTPIGMFPNTEESPLRDDLLVRRGQICYDLIYRPQETLFLKRAAQQGAITINGQKMLEIQAEESWQIWRPLCAY